jgi:hypothetical protein
LTANVKEKPIVNMVKCCEYGRMYDLNGPHGIDGYTPYCSNGCARAAKNAREAKITKAVPAAKGSSSGGDIDSAVRGFKYIGIILVALGTELVFICYKIPKFLKEKT